MKFGTALAENHFLRKLAGSVLTQVFLSAVNFLIGLYLIRTATKEEYGLYVLCFSTLQIFLSLQNAVVNTPLTVVLPAKRHEQKEAFICGLAVGQWLLLTPVLMFCTAGLSIYTRFQPVSHGQVSAFAALLFTIPASFLREYFRVLQYSSLNIRSVLFTDFAFIGGVLVCLALASLAGKVNVWEVMLSLGAACLISSGYAYRQGGRSYRVRADWIRSAFKETWPFSRWALLGVGVTNVQSFAYIFVITSMMGLSETADVSAARMFFMPFGILLASSQRIFLAKGSHLFNEDKKRFQRLALSFIGLFTILWVVYSGVVLALHEFVLLRLFTAKYGNIGHLILGWGAVFLVQSVSFTLNHSLQVMKDFKMLSIIGALSAAVTLGFCLALTSRYGLIGGMMSLLIGEIVSSGGYALRIRRLSTAPSPALEAGRSVRL